MQQFAAFAQRIPREVLALFDGGDLLDAITRGVDTDEGLAKELHVPSERRDAAVKPLIATDYLSDKDHRYSIVVPVLTAKDKAMVDAAQTLSRSIMSAWLQENYPKMESS